MVLPTCHRAVVVVQAAAAVAAELPLTVQSVSVAVPQSLYRPPPPTPAELPLTVQLVSVVVPPSLSQAAAVDCGGVAADGAVGQRGRAAVVVQAAAVVAGGVAADGAVGQRGRAPSLYRPPPSPVVDAPGDRQSRDRRRDTARRPGTPGSVPPPLTVTPAAGPVIVSVPLVSLSSSWPAVSVIVWAVAKTVGSKVIVGVPEAKVLA